MVKGCEEADRKASAFRHIDFRKVKKEIDPDLLAQLKQGGSTRDFEELARELGIDHVCNGCIHNIKGVKCDLKQTGCLCIGCIGRDECLSRHPKEV